MGRQDRLCCEQEARRILAEGEYGVLCMAAGGEPYGVPLNYCYVPRENALFFHCATKGRKLDILKENPQVVFVITGKVQIDPARFTTYYQSAIVAGHAALVTDEDEKRQRLLQLCARLTLGSQMSGSKFGKCVDAALVVRIQITSISGKINKVKL